MLRICQFLGVVLLGWNVADAGEERAGLDWWAFQPVVRPLVPKSDAGPIDSLVRARLEEEKMVAAPRADRATLIKRLYFDLVGIPPTAGEVEAFVADKSQDWYERLVDRLLASERFGERWARHWLDVVRFAETNGYERDAVKPNIWKYRDWVIRAFNEDMPYDQFVREQLAGDEIVERAESSVIATGMLRAGTWNDEPNDPQEYKYERLEDMVDVVSTAFLGLTVKCARCHDHKFDPIPQRDYYRLAAAFWPGAIEPRDGALMGGPNEAELGVKGVFGWTDVRAPPPMHLLVNGEVHKQGELVEPALLSLVPVLDKKLKEPAQGSRTSGRRAQWAEFITDRRNPLAARVMVNRIWQNLMGQGIVRTPNNFGFKAAVPSHPELLDWLAVEFMEGDWKMKAVIRKIVLSETYRQSSVHPREAEFAGTDASNVSWWKMNRRRMDAEALRDAMLAVSGELHLKMGGPSFYPVMAPEVLEGFSRKSSAWKPSAKEERMRRSVYMVSKRHLLLPLMTAFDFPNSEKPCGKRDVTTVAPQALAMLNNHFVHERSERLAKVMLEGGDLHQGIRIAWRRVLGRSPTDDEFAVSLGHFVAQQRHFAKLQSPERPKAVMPRDGLVVWLEASRGVHRGEGGSVERWDDLSGREHHATQRDAKRRPGASLVGIGGKPVVTFSGKGNYFALSGQVLTGQECTIVAVAVDDAKEARHREIFSNWDGAAGNSVTSLFLGLTGKSTVRFSDHVQAEAVAFEAGRPFVLAAVNGKRSARVLLNGGVVADRSAPLPGRNLSTRYVVGQQGNIEGEYWVGSLAELQVYDRALSPAELRGLSEALSKKYGIVLKGGGPLFAKDPKLLALESLAHVLLNSNEFLYVD